MPQTATATRFIEQPANAAVLKLLTRARGATVDEITAARGTEPHTVRSTLSRFHSVARVKIAKEASPRRGTVYHAAIRAPKQRGS
jgi:hypothetical protein